MRRIAPIIATLLLSAPSAFADLYTVEKNGVISITSRPRRGAKILRHVRDSARKPRTAQRSSAKRPRRTQSEKRMSAARRARRFAEFVSGAAAHYGLPEPLIWAVMKTESNFYPNVVSNRNAQGLMQMLPGTAKDMGVSDSFDPKQNIYGGARYLRILANRFNGDLVLTLSGYHAGGGAVNSAQGIPYSQTAEYVRRVLNHYYRFQKTPPTKGD